MGKKWGAVHCWGGAGSPSNTMSPVPRPTSVPSNIFIQTVHPMLSDRCLSCPVCPVCNVGALWPNSWIDQDETWYAGRPRHGDGGRSPPRPQCARWGPSSPSSKRKRSPQFLAHVYYGQLAGWIKMALGSEAGLGPATLLDGDPASPKRCTAPSFRPMSIVAKRLDGSRCHLVWK